MKQDDASAAGESPQERQDRHWNELLQELRVVQTGVQLLAGFLVTLPFQSRFDELTNDQKHLYLVVVCCALLAACLLIAPVSLHRMLFRRQRRAQLIVWADRLAKLGIAMLAATMAMVVGMVFDVVLGESEAIASAAAAGGGFLALWLLLPLLLRRGAPARRPEDEGRSEA